VVAVSRRTLVATAGVAAALLLLYFVPVERPGADIRIETDRRAALAAGQAQLQRFGTDPERWRLAIQLASRYEPQVGRYVLEHAGITRLNALYGGPIQTPVWRLRYFRADEREEWVVNLRVAANARLWAFEHIEPDTARGDTVSMEMAQAIAGDFLRTHDVDPLALELKESRAEQQPARVDHSFEWEAPDTTLGDAGIRYRVLTHGDRVAGMRPYVHLPEAWVRDWESKSVLQRIMWFASRAVLGLLVFAIVAVFVQQVRARRFRWRAGVAGGVAAGLLSALLSLLRWKTDVLWTYQTSTPYELFTTGAVVSLILQFVLTSAVVGVLVATALAVRPQSAALWTGTGGRRFARQGVVLAVVAVLLQTGVARFAAVLVDMAPHLAVPQDLPVLAAVARPLPWLDVFAGLLRYLLVALPVIVIVLHAAQRFAGTRDALVLVFVGSLLFAAEGARSLNEFALQAAVALAGAAAALFVAMRLLRGNDVAWVLALLLARGVAVVATWWPHPAGRTTGIIVGVLVVVTAAVVYALAARGRAGDALPQHTAS
jgi:hypothetical protein